MKHFLNDLDWTLTGYQGEDFTFNMDRGRNIDFYAKPLIKALKVKIPSSVHYDLFKNGIIDDPFFETNNLKSEWIENRCWVYNAEYNIDDETLKANNSLVLEGVNNECNIYWNSQLVASHFNVNTPIVIDLNGKIQKNNTITIAVFKISEEQNQMGRTSQNKFQTQRFGYGWDFATRMIGVGIFKDIYIDSYDKSVIIEPFIHTDVVNNNGTLLIKGSVLQKGLNLKVVFNNSIIKYFDVDSNFSLDINVGKVDLWFPNNYGKQVLYPLTIQLFNGLVLEDELYFDVGFRTIEYIQSENSAKESLPYTVVINGEKIWLCGVNVLNFSHMLGAVTEADYEFYFKKMKELNINFIRWWGGGVLEKQIFYDLADKYGILVWQDFTISSSGTDSFPSQDEMFLKELYKSSIQAVINTRNHISVFVYCGGNELRDEEFNPINYSHPLIQKLGEIAKEYNPYLFFHSSTPSGVNFTFCDDEVSHVNHYNSNIHGYYGYLGVKEHYSVYNKGDYNFQGEFGSNGCCDEETLAKFMSQNAMQGYKDASSNINWINRNSGWYNCYPRDCELFGAENMQEIGSFCSASQFIQAEGVRYIIERNRDRSFECSGCAVWQLNEPWPNSNCTTMIDYSKKPKMVSYFVKNAYAPISVNLKYKSLICEKNKPLDFELYISTFVNDFCGTVEIEILGDSKFTTSYNVVSKKQSKATLVASIENINNFGKVFYVRLKAKENGTVVASNVYLFSSCVEFPFKAIYENDMTLDTVFDIETNELILTNKGKHPILFVDVYTKNALDMSASDNFICVFPNETEKIHISTGAKEIYIKDMTRKINKAIKI